LGESEHQGKQANQNARHIPYWKATIEPSRAGEKLFEQQKIRVARCSESGQKNLERRILRQQKHWPRAISVLAISRADFNLPAVSIL
jgi:hypothetical protein